MITEQQEVDIQDTDALTESLTNSAATLQKFCHGNQLPTPIKRLLIELEYQFTQDVQSIILETLKR